MTRPVLAATLPAMRHTLVAIALLAATTGTAGADSCPEDKSLRIYISCTAELLGTGSSALTLTDRTNHTALSVTPGQLVTIKFGDYWLWGQLQCSKNKGPASKWEWYFTTEFRKKGSPAPLGNAAVGNLELASRKGKPPITIGSYHYLEPEVPHPTKAGAKLSRIDYLCELHSQ